MENHIHEWLNLTIRWIHFIVGVAWIGASFYFNWLENRLDRSVPKEPGIAGNLWAVHGGGFYHLKKFQVAPETLPEPLHWFKWEAYTTWLSGFALLVVVYYINAEAFMLNPAKADISTWAAIGIGLAAMAASWVIYDLLCESPLRHQPMALGVVLVILLGLLAFGLDQVLSSRAAYIHVGAAIGSIMVANVFFVIIPSQRELVQALQENRAPNPEAGKNGLLRSRHNNYLTLPVLFIMISSHFPSTYGNQYGWAILIALSLISVGVRHYFNIRHRNNAMWVLAIAFTLMVALMFITAPKPLPKTSAVLSDSDVMAIVNERCSTCHSVSPTQAGFGAPPSGLILESIDQLKTNAERVYATTVVTPTMPLGNLTGMTETERAALGIWLEAAIQGGGQ